MISHLQIRNTYHATVNTYHATVNICVCEFMQNGDVFYVQIHSSVLRSVVLCILVHTLEDIIYCRLRRSMVIMKQSTMEQRWLQWRQHTVFLKG